MSALERWYTWHWDRSDIEPPGVPAKFAATRWRRWVVTFYCYQVALPEVNDQITQWWEGGGEAADGEEASTSRHARLPQANAPAA